MTKISPDGVGSDVTGLREVNTKLLLNLLRNQNGPVSRQLLTELSGLSLVTVGKIVRRLEHAGFIKEVGSDRQSGGRPVGLLEFQSDAGFVVGALPRSGSLDGVIMDLRGGVVHALRSDHGLGGRGTDVVDLLGDFIDELVRDSGLDRSRVLGAGLGFPGLIDAREGRCIDSWALGLKDVELVGPLERRLGFPVLLDNDTNCLGAFEVLFGHMQGSQQGLLVSVGKGVGMAIVIDGLVYRGASGMAGDFGHSAVLGAQRQCECGRRGCLETYCSDRGIVRNYEQATGSESTLGEILALVGSGDATARRAIAEAGGILGSAIGAAVLTLDPSTITMVLVDGVAEVGDLIKRPILEGLSAQLAGRPSQPSVLVETVGYERWAQGAGSLALTQFFTPGALSFANAPAMVAV